MSRIYHVPAIETGGPNYFETKGEAFAAAQQRANFLQAQVAVSMLMTIEGNPRTKACAMLNGLGWYRERRIIRYVKPDPDARH